MNTDQQIFTGGEKENILVVALASSTGVLLLLLIAQTVGVICFIWKAKASARKAIKTDVNPIYGIEDEGETVNKDVNPIKDKEETEKRNSDDQQYDYMDPRDSRAF